jgi:hypothetical protein
MVRRVLVLAALAVSVAGVAMAVVALSQDHPAPKADIYSRLAQQLRQHLKPLVAPSRGVATGRSRALNAVPSVQQNGYSCAIATSTGCSLHPCIEYARSAALPPNGAATIVPAAPSRCADKIKALPRAILVTSR